MSQTTTAHMAESCLKEVVDVLGAESATLFVLEDGDLQSYCQAPAGACSDPAITERARRAVRTGQEGGSGGATDGSATVSAAGDGGLYVPVRSPSGVSGVLTVQARANRRSYTA